MIKPVFSYMYGDKKFNEVENNPIKTEIVKKEYPEFDDNKFDMTIGEIGGDDIKYTRTIYTRKK